MTDGDMSALVNKLLDDNERLLTEKEAAVVLGLTNPKTLANWRCQRKHADLEFMRIGRSIRYSLGSLRAFMARHTVSDAHREQVN